MIRNFIRSLEVISQHGSQLRRWRHGLRNGTRVPKVGFAAHFAAAKWAFTLRGCLQMAITSLFQLELSYRLKRWTPDFSSFEKRYSIHEMDSRKYLKCVQQLLSS
uniref:Uncharacterized protein n=1 Tax=Vitis vinifera TaxID=29760 RepID=A5C131_VITVI|nr:hypothetical protein VITISV_040701 [Vitis vinifera]